MKKLLLFLSIITFSFAQNVEISASSFESYENEKYSKFSGNVIVTKANDIIKSDQLLVYFDSNKEPTKYEAVGNVTFRVSNKTTVYNGSAKQLIYFPNTKEYNLIDNAIVEEANSDKKVYGNKISFNEKTGDIKVLSNDKAPVKFIFKVKE